jgi:hypothetical protein
MSVADEISPRTMGEDRIVLQLHDDTASPVIFSPVIVLVDYSACDPEGVVLPLEFTVTGPSGRATFQRRYFRTAVPSEITFRPREGGTHLLRIAELFHNRWWGKLVIDVAGDALDRRAA